MSGSWQQPATHPHTCSNGENSAFLLPTAFLAKDCLKGLVAFPFVSSLLTRGLGDKSQSLVQQALSRLALGYKRGVKKLGSE